MTPIPLTPPATLTPEALADLARSCYADSVAAEWWEPLEPEEDLDREAMRADLIGSEVGEALDALRRPDLPLAYVTAEGKPDGYLVEVADTAIRALDLLGWNLTQLWPGGHGALMTEGLLRAQHMVENERIPARWHHRIWRFVIEYAEVPPVGQVRALSAIVYLCAEETARHGADLVALMDRKRAYNRTRGKRHGGLSV